MSVFASNAPTSGFGGQKHDVTKRQHMAVPVAGVVARPWAFVTTVHDPPDGLGRAICSELERMAGGSIHWGPDLERERPLRLPAAYAVAFISRPSGRRAPTGSPAPRHGNCDAGPLGKPSCGQPYPRAHQNLCRQRLMRTKHAELSADSPPAAAPACVAIATVAAVPALRLMSPPPPTVAALATTAIAKPQPHRVC